MNKQKIFFRLSKKKGHIYGFVPEEGLKGGTSIVIPLNDQEYEGDIYSGLRSLVKGKVDYVKGSVISPKSAETKEEETKEEDFGTEMDIGGDF